jgi:hypothetical protein
LFAKFPGLPLVDFVHVTQFSKAWLFAVFSRLDAA